MHPTTPPEQGQSQTVVLAVVVLLGLVAICGLVGGMLLIHESGSITNADGARNEAAQIAVVFTTVGGAVGALAGILASTRTTPPAAVQAQGYAKAVTDMEGLAAVTSGGGQPAAGAGLPAEVVFPPSFQST